MKVLLVDDEEAIRRMMKVMLATRGFQVLDASSGRQALTLSQDQPIDVLVTDVVMDGMDGPILADYLIERNPDLPVLFVSGYPLDSVPKGRYSRCAFLPKPFQPLDLVKSILELTNDGVKPDGGAVVNNS